MAKIGKMLNAVVTNLQTPAVNAVLQQQKMANRNAASIDPYVNLAVSAQQANNQFNAEQAQLNRDFQAAMSSTAHQREVADLKAAGINPILSANTQGATTPSGATATADTSLTSVFGAMAQTAMNTSAQLAKAVGDQAVTMRNTDVSAQANIKSSEISANATKYAARLSAEAQRYASDNSYQATLANAMISSETAKTVADKNNLNAKEVAHIQGEYQKTVADISGKYGIKKQKLQNFVQKYSAELNYMAQNRQTDVHFKEVLIQEMVHGLGIGVNAATSVLGSIAGMFKFVI